MPARGARDYGTEAAPLARELVVPLYREGGQAQYIDTPMPTAVGSLFADAVAGCRPTWTSR